VVALHGCTQTASDFAAGTRFDSVAERAGVYVIYPEQSVMHNPNRCWNWFAQAHQRRDAGEPAEILALVETTIAKHPIDPSRVFVAGLSAGGAMAAILAEQAPDVFSAVGVMAGVALHASHDLSSARAAMHGDVPVPAPIGVGARAYQRLRATVWTGDHDHTVAPSNALSLARQFLDLAGIADAAIEADERPGAEITRWRDKSGAVRVEAWRVRRMGHAWSGGSFRGSHTYPQGPRASDAMMSFFLGGESARSVN
jgi:poly(hydroxyalkanoate) depolymerase family esterase